ncbi:exportin-5 [Copidosoma floridanum]|uniref:exportin-5 n=1 Tax=Copidosoma floridanum TaxID=29053 RepID=UPI0006C9B756|nr:exportin-5 [Copidosoma floridanum]
MEFGAGVDGNIAQISAELARYVEAMMSPNITQQQRLEVYNECERFKESSPLCAQCGLFLAQKTPNKSSIVRHFGLQLMEHCVKYRWTQITQSEKIFIKENAMKLLQEGTEPLLQEENHIKDALSRVVVEMIKREWPQQWPTLLAELSQACTRGESQTELVLLVFLRLVEDVAVLETLESNQRRKDIYQALTTNMAQIFEFFLKLMETHFSEFQKQTSLGRTAEAAAHSRVVQVVLLTLSGFVEWVSISHIMADKGRLLQIFCVLLGNPTFRCQAAECLNQVVNRKGKVEDRKQLMILFTEEALRCIYAAAIASPPSGSSDLLENHYLFLKKLVQVLNGMAIQLCSLWVKDDVNGVRPAHFGLYLDTVLNFSGHPSLTLMQMSNTIWIMLFKHEHVKTDSLLVSYIPKFVENAAPKVVKHAYPKKQYMNGLSSYFVDYDTEKEYNTLSHRLRMDLLEGLRAATLVAPLVTFAYVQQWLTVKIRKGLENPAYKSDPLDPEYLEWEALSNALDAVVSRILLVSERPSVQTGLQLIELCLSYSPQDAWIQSSLLSCISALFVFLSMSTGSMAIPGVALLPRVLEKIFASLVYLGPGETLENMSKATKNVRRHADNLMVKIGLKFPLLLLPIFDQIHTTIRGLVRQLTRIETLALYEALLLITNHFCDYERQSRFITEIIGESSSQFINVGVEVFKGPIELMRFIGLDRPAIDAGPNDPLVQNRSNLTFYVNTVMCIVKRCSIPDDPDRAARGGFVAAVSESGNPVYRNPATPHILPVIPPLFALLRAMNALFTPAALSVLSDGYKNAHNILESEKMFLIGLTSNNCDSLAETESNPLTRMQTFLSTTHDSCYHLLSSACHTIGRELYQVNGLTNALLDSVFSNLESIPDHRLRPIIRVFMKSFVHWCPPAYYETVLVPVLAHVSTHMYQRLSTKWQYITRLYESGTFDDENTDTQEVIDDMLNRNLSREFVDVLKVALVGGTAIDASPPDSMELDGGGMVVDQPSPPLRSNNSFVVEIVSELGAFILRHPSTSNSVVLCILGALSWNDSTSSFKATMLTGPVVRALVADGSLTPTMAAHVMIAVLRGLQLHGQHDSNQGLLITLGAQLYELLRPKFPNIIEVMQQIPGVNPTDLQRFDEKMSVVSGKGNKVEKGKKDLFKKITNQLIGRNISQLFRKEVKIDNLPRIEVAPKQIIREDVISNKSKESGLTALFAEPT